MIKALSAAAIAAFVALAFALLPSFTPPVEARVQQPVLKADRLPMRTLNPACAEQHWPNIDVSCLKGNSKAIQPARLVTTDRG